MDAMASLAHPFVGEACRGHDCRDSGVKQLQNDWEENQLRAPFNGKDNCPEGSGFICNGQEGLDYKGFSNEEERIARGIKNRDVGNGIRSHTESLWGRLGMGESEVNQAMLGDPLLAASAAYLVLMALLLLSAQRVEALQWLTIPPWN